MKRFLKEHWMLFVVAGVVIALDQWTKWLVRMNVPYTTFWLPGGWEWLSPFARIVHWQNSGAVFGLFQSAGFVFAILAVNIAELVVYLYTRVPSKEKLLRLVLGFILGGALGNLIDRILYGKVTDFVSVGNFPIFNVADASISISAVLIILLYFLESHKDRAAADSKKLFSRILENLSIVPALIKQNFLELWSYTKSLPGKAVDYYTRHKPVILSHFKGYLAFFALAGVLVFLDQWTKGIVREKLAVGGSLLLFEPLSFLKIVHLESLYKIPGLFQDGDFVIKILAINILEILLVCYALVPANERSRRVSLSLIFAGVLGNLIDRFVNANVTDILSIGSFPAFNIADLLIWIGLMLFVLNILVGSDWSKQPRKNSADVTT